MGYWETRLYKEVAVHFKDYSMYFMQNWKRYLDDCLIMWPESEEGLNKLKDIINNINPDIQFTSEHSKEELPFLDILIKKTVDKIETDIYYKPTDSKQYLLFNSCHPKHVATNIPYNLARRICTIVDNTETRNIRLEELKTFLKNQSYPKTLIEAGIKKAKEENQETLRQPRQKPKEKLLPFTTSYNPRNPDIFPIIKANIPLLKMMTG